MTFSPLRIKLLGPVEISNHNQPLKILRRMERTILYYLAAENRPVGRPTLIDLLWADADDIDHRGALRTALSRLRNELPEEEVLVTELDQVWLDPERCWVDLVEFTSSYDSLKNVLRSYQESRTLPIQIIQQIEETLALWRGDEILQGDNLTSYPEIEDWRRSLNQTLSHQRRTLMEMLANHYQASGRLEQALDYFVQLGKLDIFNTSFHLAVLDILTQMSRFQEIVDYCDGLEITYEQTYNAPLPDPILKHYQYSQIQLKANQEKIAPEWPISPTMELSLVGREKELNRLQKALYSGGIVVIEGELGSGKSRLVQELFQSSHPTPKLFFAPSQEMELALPFSPIIHGLRHHVPSEVWESIDCVWVNKIVLLLPELAELRGDCTASNYNGTPMAKQQLFDGIFHVLQTIAKDKPKLLFFLDDAQWADPQTLEAISYLVTQGFFDTKGLLVIAVRGEEPNRALNEMIDRFHRTQDVQTIHITGLSPQELGTLVDQALEETPSSKFHDQLYRETNGNPFLALEVVRNLLEIPGELEKVFTYSPLPLPESVHAVIRKRLNNLDDQTRRILLCAAVIGNEFSLDLLSAVIDMRPQFDIKFLDPLIKFGFIYPKSQGSFQKSDLKFTHEIMREVILKEASPLQLGKIHHRIADHLAEGSQVGSEAARIANHYLACGEVRSAFRWFIKAAAPTWSLGAKDETHQIFLQAESLHKKTPPNKIPASDVFELYRQWAQFAYEADQIDLLEEVGFKLQYLGEQAHHPLFLGVAQMTLANACFLRLKMKAGLELINKAIEYLGHTKDKKIMMEAKLRQAAIYYWTMEYDQAILTCQEVLKMGESLEASNHNLNEYLFFARHSISYSYYAKGNANKALHHATTIYHHYFHQLSAFNRVRTYTMLAIANLIAANYQESQWFSEEGLKIAQMLENPFVTQILLTTQSKGEAIQGFLDEAFAHATKALKLGEEQNYTHTIISANRVIGDIYRYLQNYSLALQYYRVAQLRGGYSNDTIYTLDNDLSLASALAWMGQVAEARSLVQHAFEVTREKGMTQLHAGALLKLALCDLIERNLSRAEANILQAERLALDNGLVYELVWCQVGYARIALSRKQFDVAQKAIERILKTSDQRNLVWMKLRGLNFCSQLHNATQEPSLLRYRSERQALLQFLSEHTQSDSLQNDFTTAKKYWEEGHTYP